MARVLFKKTGRAIWISHLDLMRLFQRAFKRADLQLTHTQGFNPRPSVSIALPLSVGVESLCELLDFELENQNISDHEVMQRLNAVLVEGVRVKDVYHDGKKIKHLTFLDCALTMEYDACVPENADRQIQELFSRQVLTVQKKGKKGITEQDIIPMIRCLSVVPGEENTLILTARICCQNPSLNPIQLCAAIEQYLPHCRPDFCKYKRLEIFDSENHVFR